MLDQIIDKLCSFNYQELRFFFEIENITIVIYLRKEYNKNCLFEIMEIEVTTPYGEIMSDQLKLELYNTKKALEAANKVLNSKGKHFCTHCKKMFKANNEGFIEFRNHIKDCSEHNQQKIFHLLDKLINNCTDEELKKEAIKFVEYNR